MMKDRATDVPNWSIGTKLNKVLIIRSHERHNFERIAAFVATQMVAKDAFATLGLVPRETHQLLQNR